MQQFQRTPQMLESYFALLVHIFANSFRIYLLGPWQYLRSLQLAHISLEDFLQGCRVTLQWNRLGGLHLNPYQIQMRRKYTLTAT